MKKCLLLATLLIMAALAKAQPLTKQDYARAVSFMSVNLVNKKVFNINPQFKWFADSSGLYFTTQSANGTLFNAVVFTKMKIVPLFDHERLAKLLGDSLKKEISAKQLPIIIAESSTPAHIDFSTGGRDFVLHISNYTLQSKITAPVNEAEEKSPDGNWIAYSSNYNLFIKSTKTGAVKQLSTAGCKDYEYASYYGWGEIIEGENGVRPPHFAVSWSPDSKWIFTYIIDLRKGQKMYLLDWSVDSLYKPKLLSYYRGSPGDTDMVYMTPVFFNIDSGNEVRKDAFRNVNAAGFEWAKEPGVGYLENHVRGYQQVDLFRCNLEKNSDEIVYSEKSNTNTDNYASRSTADANTFIISSEKNGWKQLYKLSVKEKSIQPITNGAYYVNNILFTDARAHNILFTASGKEPGVNPYLQHLYSIRMDGRDVQLLTPENAHHEVTVSPDGKYFTDNISAIDQPTQSVLRDTKTGKILLELAKADISGLQEIHFPFPEAFASTGRDGKTPIYGAIWKPSHFDPAKKYPVIDQTYTGPHTFMFPTSFASGLGRSNQALAELGFIVITVDGMGTANRSKAFHNISYKNMGKNLTDHVLAIRDLGKRYAWIDTSRVGIFGHSAGGYDAGHAVLEFPDFYKVAVASSGDHDFRMEKDWWPEMYMGWPVDSTYNQVSNITMAGNLKGKLLLVHGGIDENVNPSATFKLAEALVKADKEFDMLILPSQHHGYTGKYNQYFTKKKWNYFVEHLLGVQPIWDFDFK